MSRVQVTRTCPRVHSNQNPLANRTQFVPNVCLLKLQRDAGHRALAGCRVPSRTWGGARRQHTANSDEKQAVGGPVQPPEEPVRQGSAQRVPKEFGAPRPLLHMSCLSRPRGREHTCWRSHPGNIGGPLPPPAKQCQPALAPGLAFLTIRPPKISNHKRSEPKPHGGCGAFLCQPVTWGKLPIKFNQSITSGQTQIRTLFF